MKCKSTRMCHTHTNKQHLHRDFHCTAIIFVKSHDWGLLPKQQTLKDYIIACPNGSDISATFIPT